MRLLRFSLIPFIYHLLWFSGGVGLAQTSPSDEKLAAQASQEYGAKNYAAAERDFREMTKRHPENIYMQVYLAQTLFEQQKFADSIGPYEKARDLERTGKKLSLDQRRILVDQLAMAYGLSGNAKKAFALLQDAIREDPDYPLNYYNLACAYADEGDKDKVLANLSLAFQHKDHMLKGEQMPDPRSDSSFQKYAQDDDFIRLMRKLGYK